MRKSMLAAAALAATLGLGHQAMAQTQDHTAHQGHSMNNMPSLTEPGQGGFAALSEVVSLLMADPQTDWANVNITALRNHLVDMDLLMTATSATQEELADGVRITIQASGAAGAAAVRMVPAHSPVLAAETGWQSDVTVGEDAIVWIVRADTPEIVQALGFYGLMAIGDHHRAHHLALALGQPMH